MLLSEVPLMDPRYASELVKMKETFIGPLLHPPPSTPALSRPSTPHLDASPSDCDEHLCPRPSESLENLATSSHSLLSPVAGRSTTPVPQSMEPNDDIDSDRVLCEAPKNSTPGPVSCLAATPPCQLPEDLRICLEIIENDLLEGHVRLSRAFEERYKKRRPFALDDVLASNVSSFIAAIRLSSLTYVHQPHLLKGYSKYLLHLERAIEQVDDAVEHAKSEGSGPTEEQGGHQPSEVGDYIRRLEENAAEKGETGLVVSLSQPFQRLFQYRLIFQSLLVWTSFRSPEYENVLKVVSEAEMIVGSVKDERVEEVERDMTRDVLARINGLHTVKQLAVPKPSRVLIEERADIRRRASNSGANRGSVWFVVFNDVVLKCERTGSTWSPEWGTYSSKVNPTPETATSADTNRVKPRRSRNLYNFISVCCPSKLSLALPLMGYLG